MKMKIRIDQHFKTESVAYLSILFHLFMGMFKLLIGIFNFSYNLVIHAFYNLGIALAKNAAIKEDSKEERNKNAIFLKVGLLIVFFSFVFLVYSYYLFSFKQNGVQYPSVVAIGIAGITFSEILLAVIGIFSARKKKSNCLLSIKFTNLCSSIISLSLCQNAILSFCEPNRDFSFVNMLGSFLFGSISLLIGIYLIIKYKDSSFDLKVTR